MGSASAHVGKISLLAASLFAGALHAEVLQFDVRETFNVDVVLNNGAGKGSYVDQGIDGDPEQQDVDGAGRVWITQSVASAHKEGPAADERQGLPDDGVFPATDFHPEVKLALNNKDDGRNAWRTTDTDSAATFKVPARKYYAVHLFMTAGSAAEGIKVRVRLNYAGGRSVESDIRVNDWFHGVEESDSLYHLTASRDRLNMEDGSFEDVNAAHIFGFAVRPDNEGPLESITLTRIEGDGVLTFYGAAGVAPAVDKAAPAADKAAPAADKAAPAADKAAPAADKAAEAPNAKPQVKAPRGEPRRFR